MPVAMHREFLLYVNILLKHPSSMRTFNIASLTGSEIWATSTLCNVQFAHMLAPLTGVRIKFAAPCSIFKMHVTKTCSNIYLLLSD